MGFAGAKLSTRGRQPGSVKRLVCSEEVFVFVFDLQGSLQEHTVNAPQRVRIPGCCAFWMARRPVARGQTQRAGGQHCAVPVAEFTCSSGDTDVPDVEYVEGPGHEDGLHGLRGWR